MKLNYRRIWQYVCFAILMSFLVFALTVEANCKPTNISDLKALATVTTPKPVVTLDGLK